MDTIEEALAKIKRLEKQLERKDKELESFDSVKDENAKFVKEITKFKKEQEDITFKLKEKEKLDMFRELKFDEKHFKKVSKLTTDISIEDLKKELENEDYEIFKTKSDSAIQTHIITKEDVVQNKKELSTEETIENYIKNTFTV